ncbi:MAG: helix-turn-helix domain-containing protein [Desulfomicrobium sp.]|nr:helix-turn-helix domain-containing protein [Pseudomonadota bacterium]MBV1710781.1 helix-turn-helix domain-containing protein [Desulfomicrobium sp.]MBU4570389.1 helix-turn-helix domain-containing protein [Pseudomonadota bacterium]MBU4593310.1 helix-turn-helix domain-containing protein [Pseudomonadota bacterium]MBV1721572.1 helix-turn-helix domain-containing protein [Desulfomicrobium sp.]
MEKIGDRLLNLLKTLGITRNKMAREMGVSPQTVSNYCENIYEPKAKFLEKLGGIYNVRREWIMAGTGVMFSDCREQSAFVAPETDSEYGCLALQRELLEVRRELLGQQLRIMSAVRMACRVAGLSANQACALQTAVMSYEDWQTVEQAREQVAGLLAKGPEDMSGD